MNLENTLGNTNNDLANDIRETIIPVEIERVVSADPMENVPGYTVRQAVTNHQITSSDRLGLYKTPGWHGLGEVIEEGLTGEEAAERYLGWSVVQEPVYTKIDEKERVLPLKANVRSDTRDLLGIVSTDYVLVQNKDVGEFADALLAGSREAGVGVRMETCGSLLGGRKIFLTMRADKDVRVGKTGEDVTIPYLTLVNGHDGSTAMSAFWTFIRVCCNNSFTSALSSLDTDLMTGKGFRIRHKGKVADYLTQAKLALGLAVKGLEKYQQTMSAMASTKLNRETLAEFFHDAYEAQFGPIPVEPKTEQEEILKLKATGVIAAWTKSMGDDENLIDGIGGSLYSAFNCITAFQDHVRASQRIKQKDRQQHLKLLGQGAVDKRKALRVAMATMS